MSKTLWLILNHHPFGTDGKEPNIRLTLTLIVTPQVTQTKFTKGLLHSTLWMIMKVFEKNWNTPPDKDSDKKFFLLVYYECLYVWRSIFQTYNVDTIHLI